MPRIQKKHHTLKTPRTRRCPRTDGSPRTLLELPPELILCILEAAHDSNDLFSLILTAPIFASIWKLHAASVSTNVLTHSIECYPSARQLDLVVSPLVQQFGLASNNNVINDFYETVQSHRRILELDRCVDAFHALFLKDCTHDKRDSYYYDASIEKHQRTKIALYYVWHLVKTSTYGSVKASHCPFSLPSDLKNTKFSDTLATVEIMSWMFHSHVYCRDPLLQNLFLRAYKIYGHTDRVPQPQSQRWIMCCYAL